MKKISIIIIVVAAFLLLSSCQQIFTYSALESWAQRDPSGLSDEQQVAYAESALASGDSEAIAAAYLAIAGSDDPDTNLLASELAFAGSGVSDAIGDAAALLESGEGDFMELLTDLDGDMLIAAAEEFESAIVSGEVEPTEDQYMNAAVSVVLGDLQTDGSSIDTVMADLTAVENGDVYTPTIDDDFNPDWLDSQKSYYYVLQAGITDMTDFESMLSF